MSSQAEVNLMVERLRARYRGRFHSGLPNDSVLYDEAHKVYDHVDRGSPLEARLWASIWVYELLTSPHQIQYMTWPTDAGGAELAEFLGDLETRRLFIDDSGGPALWTDMPDVTWEDGAHLDLSDQPMDFAAAAAGGAVLVDRLEFEAAWKTAQERRPAGRPNPRLALSVVATFEELRIAREETDVA